MYKTNKITPTSFRINESTEGEKIETKVKRALTNGEGITEDASIIYTERKDGVLPEYDIRTDKWEIAVDAMDKISRDNTARRMDKIIKMNPKNEAENGQNEGGNEGGA